MHTKKAIYNLLYSILSQVVTIALGLIVPRLVLVEYGSVVNGLLNSVSQFVVYLSLLESGVQLVAMQALYKPVGIDDKRSINQILSAVNVRYRRVGYIYLAALTGLALAYPIFISAEEIGYWTCIIVVLFSGLGNVLVFFYQGKYKILLQAEGKGYVLTNIQTFITVLNSITKIICLLQGLSVEIVIIASFAVSLIQVVYIQTMIKYKYSWIDLKQAPDYSALKQEKSAIIHQIAGLVFQNTDVLILTVFCGLKVVSIYSMYKLVTSHLGSILSSIYGSVSFSLGQTYNTCRTAYTKKIDVIEVYFDGIVFAIYTVASVLFLPFIRLYTKGVSDVEYVDHYVCALFVAVELLTYIRMPMLNTINYAGRFTDTLPQTLIETGINLSVSMLAVSYLGIYGVLIGTMVALLYRDFDIVCYSNHKVLNRSAKKTLAIHAVNLVVFVVLVAGLSSISLNVESYFDFVKIGIILCPTVLAIYFGVLSICFKAERDILRKKCRQTILKK